MLFMMLVTTSLSTPIKDALEKTHGWQQNSQGKVSTTYKFHIIITTLNIESYHAFLDS